MPVKATLATVDTTKTTTSTATKAAPARRATRISAQPSVIQQSAAFWATMTGDEKNSYLTAAADMTNALAPNLPPRTDAYSIFVNLSAANIAAGQQLQAQASPYAPTQAVPSMQLISVYAGGRLTLTLVPNNSYANPVAIRAAKPLLAGANVYKSTAFKKIGFLPSLGGTVDITDMYLAHYRVPGTGYKIAIEIIGVAPGGYHTKGLYVFGIVSPTAAAALLNEPLAQDSQVVSLKVG